MTGGSTTVKVVIPSNEGNTETTKPSEKQTAFRASLLRSAIAKAKSDSTWGRPGITALEAMEANRSGSPDDWYVDVRDRRIADLAFALALPEPADSADCSEQIDALKSGGGWGYAETHREWGQEILARLAAHWGNEPDALPALVNVGELRAVATGTRNA